MLPFARTGGESAVRFDIPSLKLYFFGSVLWIEESFFFLLIFLLFFAGISLGMRLYGRLWCRWICPQSVLTALSGSLERAAAWFTGRRALQKIISQTLMLLFSALLSACLVGYFISPYDVMRGIQGLTLGPWTFWSWSFLCAVSYLNLLFSRGMLCRSLCPRTESLNQGSESGQSSTGDNQGRPAVHKRTRLPVAAHALVFAAAAMLFAYQLYARIPVDFLVVRDERQLYHQAGFKGGMMNAYFLTVENHSLRPESYSLSVSGFKDAELVIAMNPILLPPNTSVKMRIYIMAKRENLSDRITGLRFTLQDTTSPEIQIIREAPFIYPDRTERGIEI